MTTPVERPPTWREWKARQRRWARWTSPEWALHWAVYWLKGLAAFQALELAGKTTVVVALVVWVSTLRDVWETYADATSWTDADLLVDDHYLDLALKAGHLPAGEYGWVREEQAPSYELRGTHDVVVAVNAETRVRRRILRGQATTGRDVLVRKRPLAG